MSYVVATWPGNSNLLLMQMLCHLYCEPGQAAGCTSACCRAQALNAVTTHCPSPNTELDAYTRQMVSPTKFATCERGRIAISYAERPPESTAKYEDGRPSAIGNEDAPTRR